MTLLPGNRPAWEQKRRAELERQRLAYAARDRVPDRPEPAAQSQISEPATAAKPAPKPLAGYMERELARAKRRRVAREAGRGLSSGGIAGNSLGDDQRANEAQSPPGLKIHPSLAQRAMKLGKDREYRLWSLARSLPGAGSGRVKVGDIEALIASEDIGGLSPGTLRRLLKSGSPTFWTVFFQDGEKWLELRGLGAVCESLGVVRLVMAPVIIPTRWAKSLLAFRSVCYASAFPGSVWSNPISRRVIEDLIGRTSRTQRNYDAALSGKLNKRDNAKIVNGKPKSGDELLPGQFVDKVRTKDGDEHLVLLERLPNSFTVGFERGRRGMMRQVNQVLRGNSPRHVGGEAQRRKLFYRDHHAAGRRIQEQRETDWFCIAGAEVAGRHVSETIGKTQLWAPVQKAGGEVFFV